MLEAPEPLAESAIELERRALWAEIADELIAGVPLSAALLRQFLDGLRDGSLVRYAEPWQAELAGEYVAGIYADDYTEIPRADRARGAPRGERTERRLLGRLRRALRRGQIADIPRVIQAMTSRRGKARSILPAHERSDSA